mgnify:FL=1|jgi:hypothetical protein|tara:strand:+ start:1133 stop:1387 length:255 start_codon:yes stop_codon:yes gene_type:complete
MKIKGTAAALSGTTQFTSSTAVWVANTNATTHKTVTLRNTDDNADLGTLVVPAAGGVVIHLNIGEGLRGDAALSATQVDKNSGR